MGDADVVATALRLTQLRETDEAWRLLRAEHAPVIAAVLSERLAASSTQIHLDELIGLVDQDLEMLRGHGIDLSRPARAYVQEWRAAGWIAVRPVQAARAEAASLTSAALAATRFLDARDQPVATATGSRLSTIVDRLTVLARDSNPDRAARAGALEAERDALSQRIEAIRSGHEPVMSEDRALEAIIDLLALAGDVVADFTRVRAAIEQVNRTLRERVLEAGASPGAMIAETFRGVDQIAESEPGRSFAGFSELITDPTRTNAVRAAIAQVLERDFAEVLDTAERQALARLLPILMDGTREIQQVMTAFSRALRQLVMSGDYEREGALRRELRETLSEAVAAAAQGRRRARISLDLEGSGVALRSVGSQAMTSPQDFDASEEIVEVQAPAVDLEQLRELIRNTEIDLVELKTSVNETLEAIGPATVGQVLARHPATQGVASVVGLMVLAARAGSDEPGVETVVWESRRGAWRHAEVRRHRFEEAVR